MRFDLYTDAALSRDVPEHGLCRGDVVKIVDHHPSTIGESGYSIEVFNALGDTIAVTAVPESALESLHKNEVLSVRQLTAAQLISDSRPAKGRSRRGEVLTAVF